MVVAVEVAIAEHIDIPPASKRIRGQSDPVRNRADIARKNDRVLTDRQQLVWDDPDPTIDATEEMRRHRE
ncbi:hypothetical protein KHP57_09605 [Algiphilus sp. NNCM1]|uniref:hypothetical protein n=1 Tax=Algiphilus sp. TaxID=1872431 RepID=UPI001CA60B4A|nr:hypothetical protein [Algiphilus sp.]MBY8965960.1 hypothetical protein [Algiphilus acroporae]MCI5062391.1 hypothetical protein [Algiphilus sp.]MCI5102317.1 hypothetical protein [Algiphilus sp.]